ncbi:hypothetical protein ACQ4XT_08690 [Halobacillus faecis]
MVKTTKHITCSVAITSLIVGTSSQVVGNTLGAFSDSDKDSSSIQACEVFPGYINELFSDVKEELLLFNSDLKDIPDIIVYTVSNEKLDGLSEYSDKQMKEEVKRLEDSFTKVDKLQNEHLQLDEKLKAKKEKLIERAHTIYKLFNKISQLPDQTTASCLQGEYPLAVHELKELILNSGLSHSQIENLLVYYHTNQFREKSSPYIGESVWKEFKNSIEETFSSSISQSEMNNKTLKEQKEQVKTEITSVLAMIKQFEKEKEAKEEAEKEKESEEQNAKKEQEEQQDIQIDAADESSKEEEVNQEDGITENEEGNKEDEPSDAETSSSDEQTPEQDTEQPKDKPVEGAPKEKEKSIDENSSSKENQEVKSQEDKKNDSSNKVGEKEGESPKQGQAPSKEKEDE